MSIEEQLINGQALELLTLSFMMIVMVFMNRRLRRMEMKKK
jgi:hypothetical protein